MASSWRRILSANSLPRRKAKCVGWRLEWQSVLCLQRSRFHSPFFGLAYERVRALDEATEIPVSIGHLLLLGFERRSSEFEK